MKSSFLPNEPNLQNRKSALIKPDGFDAVSLRTCDFGWIFGGGLADTCMAIRQPT
jgi:hypothetical protein